jgi:hypothetical protein
MNRKWFALPTAVALGALVAGCSGSAQQAGGGAPTFGGAQPTVVATQAAPVVTNPTPAPSGPRVTVPPVVGQPAGPAGPQVGSIPGAGVTIPTNPTSPDNAYGPPSAQHWARLVELNGVFRTQGYIPWLTRAGLTWDQIGPLQEARQIEEETSPQSSILAAGSQIRGRNIWVPWPNIVTTDRPGEVRRTASTIEYKPDPANPSVLYTNVYLDGQGTVWTSGYSWGQFTSRMTTQGTTATQPNSTTDTTAQTTTNVNVASTDKCYTVAQLNSMFGIERGAQGARNGLLIEDGDKIHGAVLRLTAQQQQQLTAEGWTIQGSNASVKSAWSPNSCRPLTQ